MVRIFLSENKENNVFEDLKQEIHKGCVYFKYLGGEYNHFEFVSSSSSS